MGHLGLTPQSVHALGGFRVQGKALDAARVIVEDAVALAEAGCFAIVLECVPDAVARMVTDAVAVPTIGIGAGRHCDGQVLVYHDLLGMRGPGRARGSSAATRSLQDDATVAVARFADDVRDRAVPVERRDVPHDRPDDRGPRPRTASDDGRVAAHAARGELSHPLARVVPDRSVGSW